MATFEGSEEAREWDQVRGAGGVSDRRAGAGVASDSRGAILVLDGCGTRVRHDARPAAAGRKQQDIFFKISAAQPVVQTHPSRLARRESSVSQLSHSYRRPFFPNFSILVSHNFSIFHIFMIFLL